MENKSLDRTLDETTATGIVSTALVRESDQDRYIELSHERTALVEEWSQVQAKADDLFETIPYEVRCPTIELGVISIDGLSYTLSVYERTYATSIEDIDLCRERFPHSEADISKVHFENLARKLQAAKARARAEEDRSGNTIAEARAEKLRNQLYELEERMLELQQDTTFDDELELDFELEPDFA